MFYFLFCFWDLNNISKITDFIDVQILNTNALEEKNRAIRSSTSLHSLLFLLAGVGWGGNGGDVGGFNDLCFTNQFPCL